MRIRITTIALDHNGRIFAEGAVVEGVTLDDGETYADDEIPMELAKARLAAGSAEPVIDGVTTISPAASDAIAKVAASVENFRVAKAAFLDAAENGTDSDKLALAEAIKGLGPEMDDDHRARMSAFDEQVGKIRADMDKAAAEKPKRARPKAGQA
jgi:hypothetical protein